MTYRVGIIGTGFGTKVHYPAFRAHKKFNVVSIAGFNSEKTMKIATNLSIKGYSDWEELIRNDGLDLIAITTPPYLHYQMAKYALEMGKDLLLEKTTTSTAH